MPARPETPAVRHLDFGLLVTFAGPMAEQCLWDGSDLMARAAIHEAAHCVMAWRLGHAIAAVEIRSDGSGSAITGPMSVGTAEAVALYRPEVASSRRELSDGRRAVASAYLLRWPDRRAAHELLRVRRHEARLRVRADAPLIEAVAGELLTRGSLTGCQVEHVICETLRARWARRLEPKKENENAVYE